MRSLLLFLVVVLGLVAFGARAQQVGSLTPENHPQLSMQECTNSAGCVAAQKSITVSANWRWTHQTSSTSNCYTGDEWDKSICPDPATCAENCAVDGADYAGSYGIHASGSDLSMGFVTRGPYASNVGSRVFLLEDDSTYKMFTLKNREFTFDADVSQLPCGLNGALYFVEMSPDGGMSEYPHNQAGAHYGTGYCDAQCPHDIKFINGEANLLNWTKSPDDPNSGTGMYGTCCSEMDIWESNSISQAVTPHACSVKGQTRCSGVDCGDDDKGQRDLGVCDKDGCDFNPFRMGNHTFFGPGSQFTIDSSKPFTVVTQFITSDNTDKGDLVEIRRLYQQDGKTYGLPNVTVGGVSFDSITDKFCTAQKRTFGDPNTFEAKGGLKAMGDALGRGMVLVMSLWDDHAAHMLWLDSNYPTNVPASNPGVARGTCATDSGKPSDVEARYPNAKVQYMNIRYGEIGSTTGGGGGGGCPGGNMQACIDLCPSSPPETYKDCVAECAKRCP